MSEARRTIWRIEPQEISLALLWAVGTSAAAVANRGSGGGVVMALSAIGAAGVVLVYLATCAASVTITPSAVVVRNPFRRHAVPRHLVDGVSLRGGRPCPYLDVIDAPSIRLGVFDRWIGRVYPPTRRRGQLVIRLMREVPGQPSAGPPRSNVRIGNLGLAVAAVAGSSWAWWYLLSR